MTDIEEARRKADEAWIALGNVVPGRWNNPQTWQALCALVAEAEREVGRLEAEARYAALRAASEALRAKWDEELVKWPDGNDIDAVRLFAAQGEQMEELDNC